MSGVSVLFGVEPADTLLGTIGSSLSGGCVDLLGVIIMLLQSMQIASPHTECGGPLIVL